MSIIDFAILNLCISLFFALFSIADGEKPYCAIPNAILALVFFIAGKLGFFV